MGGKGKLSSHERRRPDWHMRWPFALAYLVLVAVGFALDWQFGLFLLAWLPVAYLSRKLLAWLRAAGTGTPTRMED